MSIWTVTRTRTERVVVHLNPLNSREFVCGRVDAGMPDRDLLAWIVEHARPFDVIDFGYGRLVIFLGDRGTRA